MLVSACTIMLILSVASLAHAGDVKQGDTITIVTPGTVARLCPIPLCAPEKHITRIPAGTELRVEDIEEIKIGTIKVKWFAVAYDGSNGWVSIYDTDKVKH